MTLHKPGLFSGVAEAFQTRRHGAGDEFALPMALALPMMMLVSVGLWTCIWMVVRALL